MQVTDETQKQKLNLNERINQIWSTTQGKTYTTAIATVVVVVFMAMFAIVPAYISITDQIALNDKKTIYLADVSTKQKNLNDLMNQRNAQSTAITLLDIYLGSKIDNELLVASFSKIAEDYKCKFEGATFADPADSLIIKDLNSNSKAISFSATMSCKIGDMADIYKKMIGMPTLINITGVSYTNRKDQGGGGTSNFFYDRFAITFSGEYYYWPGIDTSSSTIDE